MQTQVKPLSVERRLNTRDVEAITGKSRQTIWRYVKSGIFPHPSYINGRMSWTESQIQEWQDNLQSFEERQRENLDVIKGGTRNEY